MSCRIGVNLLDSAVVTMTPAADSLYPVAGLSDGPGMLPARFSSLAANPEARIDLATPIDFGNGDGPGNFSGAVLASDGVVITLPTPSWTVDADTSTAQLQTFDDGTAALADHGGNGFSLGLGATVGPVVAAYAMTVKAGRRYRIKGWVANGTSALTLGSLRLFDRTTGKYLTSAGAWTPTPTAFVTDTTFNLAWVGGDVTFTAPTATELGADTTVFEFQIRGADSGFVFADDLEFYVAEAADLMMVAGGHNLNAAVSAVWQTSDDASSWTTRATFTVERHQFFSLLAAPVTARHHRLRIVGTPTVKHWLGEVILAATQALPRTPREPVDLSYSEIGQTSNATPGGTRWTSNRAPAPLRTLKCSWTLRTSTETQDAKAILIDGLRGGATACVILPSTLQFPDLALFGTIAQPIDLHLALQGAHLEGSTDDQAREHYADMSATFTEGPVATMP